MRTEGGKERAGGDKHSSGRVPPRRAARTGVPSASAVATSPPTSSARSCFICAAVSTGLAASAVLSANVAWPVRLVCTSCSVAVRHGLPHSVQTRLSTASVDSLNEAWPVASPWSLHSAALRSCALQVSHFRESAMASRGRGTAFEARENRARARLDFETAVRLSRPSSQCLHARERLSRPSPEPRVRLQPASPCAFRLRPRLSFKVRL